jgi:hypothetical protein
MKQIVKLDRNDLHCLINTILSEIKDANKKILSTGKIINEEEISTTKSQITSQARQELNILSGNEDIGIIVSLFIILLTDKSSELVLRSIGKQYDDFISKGGNEVDVTSRIVAKLKPLVNNFVSALIESLGADVEDDLLLESKVDELHSDYEENTRKLEKLKLYAKKDPNIVKNPKYKEKIEFFERNIEDIKKELHLSGEGPDTTKQKLRATAIARIDRMSSNPEIVKVFSIFLEFLTDKDTKSVLQNVGSIYGKKLRYLVNTKPYTWTVGLLNKLRSKFTPLITGLIKSSGNIAPVTKKPTNKPQEPESKEDIKKIDDILSKYNF